MPASSKNRCVCCNDTGGIYPSVQQPCAYDTWFCNSASFTEIVDRYRFGRTSVEIEDSDNERVLAHGKFASSVRVLKAWNKLPPEVVNVALDKIFKLSFDGAATPRVFPYALQVTIYPDSYRCKYARTFSLACRGLFKGRFTFWYWWKSFDRYIRNWWRHS